MNHRQLKTPHRGMLIAILLSQIAFGLLAMTICLPSMQEWGAVFDSDQAAVQLTFSGYVVAYGAMQLVYGPMSDRYGRKGMVLAGLALAGVGSLLAALAPNLAILTIARTVQGAGAAAGMVLGRAMVRDLFDGATRTEIMAYVGMLMGVCPPTAIVIGGQLHVLLGWQANFVAIGLLALVLLLLSWRALPSLKAQTTTQTHWLKDMAGAYTRLGREPAFLLYVTIVAMSSATFYSFLGGAPIVLRHYGIGPDQVGWYMAALPLAYIGGNYLTSRLIQHSDERRVMALGQLATIGGLILMLALGLTGLNTPLAFVLPLTLVGMGQGLLVPPCLAGTVGIVPSLAGSAAAVAGLCQQWMGAVGGYTVGLLQLDGATSIGMLMMGFTLCALSAQILLHRR